MPRSLSILTIGANLHKKFLDAAEKALYERDLEATIFYSDLCDYIASRLLPEQFVSPTLTDAQQSDSVKKQ